jgi:hypothetical protein
MFNLLSVLNMKDIWSSAICTVHQVFIIIIIVIIVIIVAVVVFKD